MVAVVGQGSGCYVFVVGLTVWNPPESCSPDILSGKCCSRPPCGSTCLFTLEIQPSASGRSLCCLDEGNSTPFALNLNRLQDGPQC